MNIHGPVRDYIQRNLVVFEDDMEWTDDTNIFQLGLVHSLFAMQLLQYIESEFRIVIENEDMDIRHFSSVNQIAAFIANKLDVATQGSQAREG